MFGGKYTISLNSPRIKQNLGIPPIKEVCLEDHQEALAILFSVDKNPVFCE